MTPLRWIPTASEVTFRAPDAAARKDGPDGTGTAPTGVAARRAETGRATLAVARFALRAALVTLPRLAVRALFWPREQPLSGLSDRQLADVGLTRADVARPHERPGRAEIDIRWRLMGRDRR